MKFKTLTALTLSALLLLSGCSAPADSKPTNSKTESADASSAAPENASASAEEAPAPRTLTDAFGTETELPENPCVVSLYGSFAECWQLSGGSVIGVTEDAAEDGRVLMDENTAVVGTLIEPNLEEVAALSPDYVLLSADVPAQIQLDSALSDMQIPHGYFHMDTFDDYADIMKSFCALNDQSGQKYTENVSAIAQKIETIKDTTWAKLTAGTPPTVLLLRAYSTGVKAKTTDTVAGVILKELGARNIADDVPSLLEDLSLEAIVQADPDYIFVLSMGSEESAKSFMAENLENNPAWSELSAVKNGRYTYLPKALFHYKPLNRWDESYAYLADILSDENA